MIVFKSIEQSYLILRVKAIFAHSQCEQANIVSKMKGYFMTHSESSSPFWNETVLPVGSSGSNREDFRPVVLKESRA